ncbi:MAG: pseudaminic acid synthase [Alphaproteobacteria bacterium]
MVDEMQIAGRKIGPGHPPYIIAEMSGNHNGDIDRAFALIEAAKEAGADAVKLQTYTADTITIKSDRPEFKIAGGLWDGYTLHDLYDEAHTPWDWHPRLFEKAKEVGITIFSSPFDFTAIDFLESLDAPAYKIASFELVDLPLIIRAAATGKPLIMSTGIANLDEIEDAIAAAKSANVSALCVLHCISAYPAPASQSHLQTIPDLAKRFDVLSGLSDHTMGTAVATTAIAMGACLIEKHFTLARADGGVDSDFSLEPHELKRLVDDCRTAWEAMGPAQYELKGVEEANQQFRRSLYITAEMKAGDVLSADNLRSIRPGNGLPPRHYDELLGKAVSADIAAGTPLSWDLIKQN